MSRVLAFEKPPGKPVMRGIDFFWKTIRELGRDGGTFTVFDVWGATNTCERATVADFVRRLEAAGFVEPTGESRHINKGGDSPLYRLLQRPLETPILRRDGSKGDGTAQVQMWNIIRGPDGRHGLTARDLALLASTDEVVVKEATAKAYAKHLKAAGYLQTVQPGRAPSVQETWRLKPSMNTGPKPPLILRTKIVFDQNRNAAMAPIVAEEVEP